LQRESSLLEIVQLLGTDSLAPAERVVLQTGRLLREDFLQQSAFDERDAYCPLAKQHAMLRVVRASHEAMEAVAARGVSTDVLDEAVALRDVGGMRAWPEAEAGERADSLIEQIRTELGQL
jgi:V/A-type H+-transporting ATPase subunit A